MGTLWIPCQVLLLALLASGVAAVSPTDASTLYRGKFIGSLTARAHKVSGEVYAVDGKTLHIRNFVYSGSGPDAFFWVGFTEHPSPQGIIVPNEKGTKDVLGAYNMQDITLTLPGGLTLKDIKWFGVWCRAYEVNFGDLYIPADLDFPQPHVIGSLSGQHAVSSGPIVIIDSSTILVPDFSYDGQGPSVHFWVGKGKPGPEGHKLADETGSEAPLKKSDKKTMVLSLPAGLTIFDIDYLSIWCELYFVDFGHVKIPRNLNVPPSLQMLGVTPQLAPPVAEKTPSQIRTPAPNTRHYEPTPPPPFKSNPSSKPNSSYQKPSRLSPASPRPQRYRQPPQLRQEVPTKPRTSSPAPQRRVPATRQSQLPALSKPLPSRNQVQEGIRDRTKAESEIEVGNYERTEQHEAELLRNTPLIQSPSSLDPQREPPQFSQLGTNGFSSITIRTSKGSSSALSLY